MGIKITTDDRPVKVFRKDFDGKPKYSIALSRKEGDSWVRIWKPIRFTGGASVSDGQEIYITDAFPSVDSWVTDGKQHTREVWVIRSCTIAAGSKKAAAPAEMLDLPDSFSQAEDDVPF